MKKVSRAKPLIAREEMRAEYNFSGGVRGKYSARFAEGTNLVLLEPDVAAAYPTARAVNKALRTLMKTESKSRSAGKRA
ncbi:MAG: hypothetical protein M3Y05_10715 [Gemmatimonadota bacterium]|nr:hypothetical protein [Gemmatimonadota bacterium]